MHQDHATDRVLDSRQQSIVDVEIALANLRWALENRERLLTLASRA
jgi:hypothetical protein